MQKGTKIWQLKYKELKSKPYPKHMSALVSSLKIPFLYAVISE